MQLPSLTVAAPLFALVALWGCAAAFDARHDFDPEADFSQFETFTFAPKGLLITGPVIAATKPFPKLEDGLRDLTLETLQARGYRFVETLDDADFVVAYTFGGRNGIQTTAYASDFNRARGWGRTYYGNVQSTNYTEGILALDVFDVDSRQPVFHSRVTRTITGEERGNVALLEQMVAAMFADFPPE